MSAPAVTIITPAFQAQRTIGAAIDSALAQTVASVEVLVVDDGSTDATVATVQARADRDPRVRLLRQANAGPSAARNRAIAQARGAVVAFLDADDLMLPSYVERMLAVFAARPDVDLVACDAWIFDERYGRVRRRTLLDDAGPPTPLPSDSAAQFAELARRNFVYVGCAVRTPALHALDGFDAASRTNEDWDLWLRLLASGRRMELLREPLAVYRYSEGQAHRDRTEMQRGRERLDAWIASTGLAPGAAGAGPRSSRARAAGLHAARAVTPRPLRGLLACRRRPPAALAAAFPDLTG